MATISLPQSKLPNLSTSIFAEMSALARETGALNLSQGFPDFPVSADLVKLLGKYASEGVNQYAPMAGLPQLREAIASKFRHTYGIKVSAETEITITAGATEALFCAISAMVSQDDEVIILEPAYDSYGPAVELQNGKPVYVSLNPIDFTPDWPKIEKAFSRNTRLLILNTPHNPTGSVWSRADMQKLEELLEHYPDCWVLSDEVYEHIIFDELEHHSVLRFPNLRERAAAVYSFGKTFHATGWKVGYVVAPPALTTEIRKIHQYVTFSVHTSTQYALAEYLQEPAHYSALGGFYQQKRDALLQELEKSNFEPVPSHGTYFQLVKIPAHLKGSDRQIAHGLTHEYGVATIPISPFYHNGHDPRMLRICFAKQEETLERAGELLRKI
jgi:methionine aminotransferase